MSVAAVRTMDAETGRGAPGALSWALCVATLNRIDALETCVRCALGQTRPPDEIVIVDASEDFDGNRDRIAAVVEGATVPLRYIRAAERSLTVQRNQGIRAATADVLFLIDDDSFMYADCADIVLRVYESDPAERIGCVTMARVARPPSKEGVAGIDRKEQTSPSVRQQLAPLVPAGLRRFVVKELLLLSIERRFVPYDAVFYPRREPLVVDFGGLDVTPTLLCNGFRITVRRRVALLEPFDDGLLAYCPAEDLDATYRFLRHGRNAVAHDAKVYHHEAAANRLKKRQAAELGTLNIAYFIRTRAANQPLFALLYYVWGARRTTAALVTDVAARGFGLPVTRGVLAGIARSVTVFTTPRSRLKARYREIQAGILNR